MTLLRTAHGAWNAEEVGDLVDSFAKHISQYGIVLLDPLGRITGWSEGSYCITGFSAEEVLDRGFSILFADEDVRAELHRHELNAAAMLGAVEDERWHTRKDGSAFWASGMTFSRRQHGRHLGFAKLFRDATHLRLRTQWLENEVQRLERQHHDQTVFIGTIAHELRNPLQPIGLATRLLALSVDPKQIEQAAKIIRRQVAFVERLVEDLVDMTRVGEGKLHLRYDDVLLQPLVEEAIEACGPSAVAAGVELLSVLPPVMVRVQVDSGRIHQVVTNLLNNAIKFTPRGGRASVLVNVDGTHFLIKVLDTGCGIGPELQPRIFDMFTQADGADSGRGHGLGIGLALVKEIVSLHGGTIEVRSEGRGRGSEFIARLPILRQAPRTLN